MKALHASVWGGLLVGVMWLGCASGAEAQTHASRTFGPAPLATYTIHALALTGMTATEIAKLDSDTADSRKCSSPCLLGAPVFLPAGAVVEGIELEACGTFAPRGAGHGQPFA